MLDSRAATQEKSGTFTATKPCVYSSPEFFFLANAPRNIVDCIQLVTPYPDGYGRSAYVLDKDGTLWEWSHLTGAYSNLFLVYFLPGIGIIVGLVVGIIWVRRSHNRAH